MSSQGVAVARGYPSWDRACYTGIRGRQAPGIEAEITGNRGRAYRDSRRYLPGLGTEKVAQAVESVQDFRPQL